MRLLFFLFRIVSLQLLISIHVHDLSTVAVCCPRSTDMCHGLERGCCGRDLVEFLGADISGPALLMSAFPGEIEIQPSERCVAESRSLVAQCMELSILKYTQDLASADKTHRLPHLESAHAVAQTFRTHPFSRFHLISHPLLPLRLEPQPS